MRIDTVLTIIASLITFTVANSSRTPGMTRFWHLIPTIFLINISCIFRHLYRHPQDPLRQWWQLQRQRRLQLRGRPSHWNWPTQKLWTASRRSFSSFRPSTTGGCGAVFSTVCSLFASSALGIQGENLMIMWKLHVWVAPWSLLCKLHIGMDNSYMRF